MPRFPPAKTRNNTEHTAYSTCITIFGLTTKPLNRNPIGLAKTPSHKVRTLSLNDSNFLPMRSSSCSPPCTPASSIASTTFNRSRFVDSGMCAHRDVVVEMVLKTLVTNTAKPTNNPNTETPTSVDGSNHVRSSNNATQTAATKAKVLSNTECTVAPKKALYPPTTDSSNKEMSAAIMGNEL